MSTLDQAIQETEVLTNNLSAIAAQNQQANRNSNNEGNSAVEAIAFDQSEQAAASQAQNLATTLSIYSTGSSSSGGGSAVELMAAAAQTSAIQGNARSRNAQECCCQEIKITISDLAFRYNYDNFALWEDSGYSTLIGRITMETPPEWDTFVTLKITNLSTPDRSAQFTVMLPAGIVYRDGEWIRLDPPYTDVFDENFSFCKLTDDGFGGNYCEYVSFLTQPFFCESCKIEYISAFQYVETYRESAQYKQGPFPYNQRISPEIDGLNSESDIIGTVQICPYVGEFEFTNTVIVHNTTRNNPYFSPFTCNGFVGLKAKKLPTFGFLNIVLKQSDGMTITPEDENPNDDIPAPPPYWAPGWVFNATDNNAILNPNQSALWSWNTSEGFTMPPPTETNPFDIVNGGAAGVAQINASSFQGNNYSTRFSGDWEFDVFEKKWVVRTYDKYFRLNNSDNWEFVGSSKIDGYEWDPAAGQWVWSEDNEEEFPPDDVPPPDYAPTKSPLPPPVILPSEEEGYRSYGFLDNANSLRSPSSNFKIYVAAAASGGFSSHTLSGATKDPPASSIHMIAYTKIPQGDSDYIMDTAEGIVDPPAGMTYSITQSGVRVRFDCVTGEDCGNTSGEFASYLNCAIPTEQSCVADIYWCSESSRQFNFTVTGTAQRFPAGMDVLTIRHFPETRQPRLLHYSDSEGFLFCRFRYQWPFPCEASSTNFIFPPLIIGSRCAVRDRKDVRNIQPPYNSYNGMNRLLIAFHSGDGCNKAGVYFEVDFNFVG